ncbi:MAG: TRAP transporter substrate-binding protein [Sphaerochaetaceae bacterium]|jgi:tripartite ATP-independent transporter DctP family solute receptor
MNGIRRIFRLSILCCLAVVFVSGCERASDDRQQPQLVLRYADNQPDHFPTSKAARYFAALVKERTGGRIEIDVFTNGELGQELETLEQIEFGGVDFSRFSLGTLATSLPFLKLLFFPYLYRDSEHMWKVLDGKIGLEFLARVDSPAGVGLCWFDAGARSFYTRTPIHSIEDIEGMTIRVQENELLSLMIESLGARTERIPYSEVYSLLQRGAIDGAENNIPSYVYMGHHQAAPYLFLDEHFRIPELVLMSKNAEEKIKAVDPSFLDVVRDCAKQAGEYQRTLWERDEAASLQEAVDSGCVITVPDADELSRWAERMESIYRTLDPESLETVRRIQAVD